MIKKVTLSRHIVYLLQNLSDHFKIPESISGHVTATFLKKWRIKQEEVDDWVRSDGASDKPEKDGK
jgi:hypothetical protein